MSMGKYSVLDKATKESSSIEAVCDLGVKLQSSKLLVPWKMMMAHRDDDYHHRPFLPHGNVIGDVDADGPTGNSNNRPKTTNIYDVFASSDSGAAAVVASGGAVGVRTLQPFDISPTTNSTAHTAFKSPGDMAASLELPFTSAQWKELERQAMIYKYMKASIPVPPDLLIPLTGNPSLVPVASHSAFGSGALNPRFSSRDPEPGRCRRTDGKKWRCSRDVAPDQKYCERHMHRGRPRSRKPVELPNKKTRHTQAALPSSSPTILTKNASSCQLVGTLAQPFHQNHQATCFLDKPSEKASPFWPLASVSSYKEPRTSDWIFNEELFPLASYDQQLHHLMQIGTSSGSSFSNADNSSVLNQNYSIEPLNLNLYSNFRASEDQQSNHFPLFLNSEILPLGRSPEVATRGFIDAWSNHHNANSGTETSVSSNAKLSLSSLSLSMGVDNTRDDSLGPIHMGLGVGESDQNPEYATKSHLSSWLAPASWATFTPGGPLAEVLRPSKITTTVAAAPIHGYNPPSPVTGDGNSCSPPLTAVSSPSGVLQRTLASWSDSSASSSPTLASSGAKPEIGLMWLKGN